MGRKKRVREEGSEDDAWLYGEEPLPDMSKKPGAPRNEAQPQGKRNTELPPDLRDCVKAALLRHYGHDGAAGAGPLQVLQERVAPGRIADVPCWNNDAQILSFLLRRNGRASQHLSPGDLCKWA